MKPITVKFKPEPWLSDRIEYERIVGRRSLAVIIGDVVHRHFSPLSSFKLDELAQARRKAKKGDK